LGVIPIGTGNDFIRSTNSPNTIVGLKQSIEKDRTQLIDVGLATFISEKQQESRRYFINVVDVGLGGYVSCRLKDSSVFNSFLNLSKGDNK
jgi:diacylglycerol kinase family enzyme